MLLAPISAVAGVSAIVISARVGQGLGMVLFACSAACCFFTGSRSAMASGAVAWIVTFILSGNAKTAIAFLFIMVGLTLGFGRQSLVESVLVSDTANYWQKKGLQDTRSALWETRIQEFKEHPVFGLGINMAMEVGEPGQEGVIRAGIEPGSSWLSFLSMTGIAGSGAYVLLIVSILSKFVSRWRKLAPFERAELAGASVFLALHTVFEGYALAVGSLMALVFWLAWGRLGRYRGCSRTGRSLKGKDQQSDWGKCACHSN